VPLTWQGWPTLAAVRKHSPASPKAVLCQVTTCRSPEQLGFTSLPACCLPVCLVLSDDAQNACVCCMDQACAAARRSGR